MENQETKNTEKKDKNIGLMILSTAGVVGSVGLGVFCYQLSKENKALKIDKELYKDALAKIAETGELVKRVVGGPLIDRLIKNEELKLSKTENKIAKLLSNNVTEATKVVVEEMEAKKQNIVETIADFVEVRNTLR